MQSFTFFNEIYNITNLSPVHHNDGWEILYTKSEQKKLEADYAELLKSGFEVVKKGRKVKSLVVKMYIVKKVGFRILEVQKKCPNDSIQS